MHLACIEGDLDGYKAIASYNYQVKNTVDNQKKTPLDYAVELKKQAILDFEKSLTVTLYSKNKEHKAGGKFTPEDFEFIMPLGKGAFGEVILVKVKHE